MKNKKSLMAVAGIVVVALAAGVIYQQTGNKTDKYPSRDINMVVPWNPGGSTDLTGRALADAMGKSMGTNIVVTNTPGSGGSVGSLTVQKAEKDGYNILANGMLALTAMPVLGYTETTQKDWDFYLATFTPNAGCTQGLTLPDSTGASGCNEGQPGFHHGRNRRHGFRRTSWHRGALRGDRTYI